MKIACGTCNYQGDSKAGKDGARIFCLYNQNWQKDSYSCPKWSEYSYNLGKSERLQLSLAERQREVIEINKNKSKENQNMNNADIWLSIVEEFGITKKTFGKNINFIKDPFCRKVIFRDVEHAYILAKNGFSKPSVILAGAIIEELLRQYLKHKKIKPAKNKFDEYIRACQDNGILKSAIHSLSNSIRHFRNIVHIENEKSSRHTISKATAKGAVSSIFTISNDFK